MFQLFSVISQRFFLYKLKVYFIALTSQKVEDPSSTSRSSTAVDVVKDGDSAFHELSSLEDTDVTDQLVWKKPVCDAFVRLSKIIYYKNNNFFCN